MAPRVRRGLHSASWQDVSKFWILPPTLRAKRKTAKFISGSSLRFTWGGRLHPDDLLDLAGDCTPQGYQIYSERTFAFTQIGPIHSNSPAEPAVDLRQADQPFDPLSLDRIRKAAFAITNLFEGKGYPSYQNGDSGIVSYGRFQFSLGAGSLGTVCRRYCDRSLTQTAEELRANFRPRVLARDPGLRIDLRLRDLLIAAAEEDVMKTVQNEVATEGFWSVCEHHSAATQHSTSVESAMLFDIAINLA